MASNFFIYLPFLVFLLAATSLLERRRISKRKINSSGEAIPLAKFAERLFEKEFHGNDPKSRIEDALNLVLAKFEAGLVVVRSLSRDDGLQVIAQKRMAKDDFHGEINDDDLYCRTLTKKRLELDLDYAGSGPWRDHPSRSIMGWESYYGLRKNHDGDCFISIGIYHSAPRILRISAADKIFLQNLLAWIETTLQRRRRSVETGVLEGNSATATTIGSEIPLKN